MDVEAIFVLQFVMSLLVWGLLAHWLLAPWLEKQSGLPQNLWVNRLPSPLEETTVLAKPQGFPRKLGGCAGLDPRLRSAVSAGVGDGERGLRRGLRAPGVGVRPKWVLEYSPSNKRIRYFVSITYVRTGLWTAHKFCGGGKQIVKRGPFLSDRTPCVSSHWNGVRCPGSSCSTAAGNFCRSCCLCRLAYRRAGVSGARRSSE